MRESEGAHRLYQHPAVAHDQQQPEHEQQVVDAKQNMLDAKVEIGPRSAAGVAGIAQRHRGLDGLEHVRFDTTVSMLNAHQDVGGECFETLDGNSLAREPAGAFDSSVVDPRRACALAADVTELVQSRYEGPDGRACRLHRVSHENNSRAKSLRARYQPERYPAGHDPQGEDTALVGLMRSGLLKRFESSVWAFGKTCERMVSQHEEFLAALGAGLVPTSKLLHEWSAADDEADFADFLADDEGARPAEEFNVEALRRDVSNDLSILRSYAAAAHKVRADHDPKLARPC